MSQIDLPSWLNFKFDIPWIELLGGLLKVGRKIIRGYAQEGMYEVLDYESTLELQDVRGERAKVTKLEKVKYLQDYIIAYQDQAWGDGKILVNYHCSPGKPVDRYKPGNTTYILISLEAVKRRGNIDDFQIEWEIQKGFLREKELWETEVRHRTRRITMNVIFPRKRPPSKALLIENMRQRSYPLPEKCRLQLPDGRWQIFWEINRPRLYERYSLQWIW